MTVLEVRRGRWEDGTVSDVTATFLKNLNVVSADEVKIQSNMNPEFIFWYICYHYTLNK